MIPREAYALIKNDRSLIGNAELESSISTNTHYSYLYASEIIKDRFKLGESLYLRSTIQDYRSEFISPHSKLYWDSVPIQAVIIHSYKSNVIYIYNRELHWTVKYSMQEQYLIMDIQ